MATKDDIAQRLAATARNSLSTYCSTECKAYCCRQGHLLLTAEEADTVMNVRKGDLRVMSLAQGKRYVLDLGSSEQPCPNLEDFKCRIHKTKARPKACREFPLFIRDNKVIFVSLNCPAARENKLYPFLAKFKKMGYAIT
jgi:Fe-S-cluster containining protein